MCLPFIVLVLVGGCAEPRLPITWRPLDEAGTTACVIAREAVEGNRGTGVQVWVAIRDEALRSDRNSVHDWAETLDSDIQPARNIELPRRAEGGRDIHGDPVAASRSRIGAKQAITTFYEQCPSGFPVGPTED